MRLNTVLTVRRGHAGSHAGHGWEQFTSAVVDSVAAKMWGDAARAKGCVIDRARHVVIECPHPSPLSAWRGFLGGKPFSRTNLALQARGADPIDWALGATGGLETR
jgi:uracil-DNA glycosylase